VAWRGVGGSRHIVTDPSSHLGARRGSAGTLSTFYAASLDKAGFLTSNAAGSPSRPLGGALPGEHESKEQAERRRVGDLKATQATSSYSSDPLDPRPFGPSSVSHPDQSHGKITMSSNNPLKRSLDDSGGGPAGPDAKRRKFRACVTCRRQKARCEFVNAHDRCHRCTVLQIHCVFEGQAHANLLAASAPVASAQSGSPFPHAPLAIPTAYDTSPQQLSRSAGSEHARCVISFLISFAHLPTQYSDQPFW
jgi:hypothetical protein